MKLDVAALTHTGRRKNNEDACAADPELGLFVVADGMGGYEGGEVASKLAVAATRGFVAAGARDNIAWAGPVDFARSSDENELLLAAAAANDAIAARRHGPLAQMGTTLAAIRVRAGRAIIAHCGDSRVYRVRAGVVRRLTDDHSLYNELLKAGDAMARADFAWGNVVTRALGTTSSQPEVATIDVAAGDVFLLATDGLWDPMSDAELLAGCALPADAACAALVERAYQLGSKDNITAIVVRVLEL